MLKEDEINQRIVEILSVQSAKGVEVSIDGHTDIGNGLIIIPLNV